MRGSVRKVGTNRWRLVFDAPTDGPRRQITRTITAKTKKLAEDELRQLMVRHGKTNPQDDRTLSELVDRWFKHTDDLASTTIESRERVWRIRIQPTLGDKPAKTITTADINDLYAQLRDDAYKPASIIKVHAFLSGVFTFAVREGTLDDNPVARARRPKQPRTEPRIPKLEAVAACLAEADRRWPEYGVLVRLLARTGMRRGEVCALRWNDVDLEGRVIHVRRSLAAAAGELVEKPTKTERPRDIAIGANTVAMLKRHRTTVRKKRLEVGAKVPRDGYVFPWTLDGDHPMHPSTVTHRWNTIRTAVGAPTVRLHDLRHHTASQLIAANTDLRTVMERHGWTSLATAQRYIHAVEAKDRDAANVLEEIV